METKPQKERIKRSIYKKQIGHNFKKEEKRYFYEKTWACILCK